MAVIVTGYTLFVTLQYDVIFTFANQRFGEVVDTIMKITAKENDTNDILQMFR